MRVSFPDAHARKDTDKYHEERLGFAINDERVWSHTADSSTSALLKTLTKRKGELAY